MNQIKRCGWARTELDIEYHDTEWGVPVHDDRSLFELLILECYAFMQAVGMVNDHIVTCFRYREVSALRKPALR